MWEDARAVLTLEITETPLSRMDNTPLSSLHLSLSIVEIKFLIFSIFVNKMWRSPQVPLGVFSISDNTIISCLCFVSAAANSKYFLQSLFKEIFKSVLREEGGGRVCRARGRRI